MMRLSSMSDCRPIFSFCLMLIALIIGSEAFQSPQSVVKSMHLLGIQEEPGIPVGKMAGWKSDHGVAADFGLLAAGEDGVAVRELRWWHKMGRSQRGVHHERKIAEEVAAFFSSVVVEEWLMFIVAWILLIRLSLFIASLECTHWYQHALAFSMWVVAAAIFLGLTWMNWGAESGAMWLDGYLMELILAMENIFLYEMIMVSFKVPAKLARYALFVVSLFQMVFQMFLFMGIAAWIQSLENLPYLLGAWLIFVALQTMRDDEHEGFDAQSSESYKAFRLAMGERLLPDYGHEGTIFVYRNGRLCVTMLGPVVCCLLVIMFAMEVDVTLTKIEEIPNHFLAWSSSVLAAFALPELFVVVQEMLRRFYLLKTGISLLLLFFGALLVCRNQVEVSDTAELVVMLGIVVGSMVLSPLLGYESRDSAMYLEDQDSMSPKSFAKKCASKGSEKDEDAFETSENEEEEKRKQATQTGAAGEALEQLSKKS